MSTTIPYKVDVQRIGGGQFSAVVTQGGDTVAEFEDKSVDGAVKKAKAYAASHKAANTPATIETFSTEFHL